MRRILTPVLISAAIALAIMAGSAVAVRWDSVIQNQLVKGILYVLEDSQLGNAATDKIDSQGYFTYVRIGTGSTFGHISTVGTDELGVEGQGEVDGSFWFDGNVTLGDAVGDTITATGYFTQMRVGTGTTFGHIAAVGADELGVEGQAEIDGSVWLDGAVTLGDAAGDTITATGYFTQMRVGTGTTFGNIGAVGADELGVEGAAEIDGALYADGGITIASGQNALRGTYSIPAARDSAETTKPLIQYGSMAISSDPDTIDYTTEGLSDYNAAPKLQSLFPVYSLKSDTLVYLLATAVNESLMVVRTQWKTSSNDSVHASALGGITAHYCLIGY